MKICLLMFVVCCCVYVFERTYVLTASLNKLLTLRCSRKTEVSWSCGLTQHTEDDAQCSKILHVIHVEEKTEVARRVADFMLFICQTKS